MAKLTASQVAAKVNISVYTLKRWYKWYEGLNVDELSGYITNGMPELPAYETIGNTAWRYWNEEDVEKIIEFKDWVPHTRAGVMGSLSKKGE